MSDGAAAHRPDRREFLRVMTSAGALFCLGGADALAAAPKRRPVASAPEFTYQYRTLSARHVREVGDWYARLDRRRQLSTQPTYRKYIGNFRFHPPKELPGARSLVIIAIPQRICAVTFRVDGGQREVLIPTGYVDQGVPAQTIQDRVRRDVLGGRGRLFVPLKLPQKILAVRSGLAEYGRNNITFVEGYGSFHELRGYWTDRDLPDHWRPLRLMRECKGCSICLKACPTRAFANREFVLDAGKCLTLYNELEDPFPAWIPSSAHHTLVGCLRCQYTCPGNRDHIHEVERLAEIPEAETRFLLSGMRDPKLEKAIMDRLPRYPVGFPHFARAARLALANGPVV